MNLKKQSGGIWVKCSDELPTKDGGYLVFVNKSEIRMYFNGKRFESEEYKTPTEWLKPVYQVILLTQEEIDTLKFQEYNRGVTDGRKHSETQF